MRARGASKPSLRVLHQNAATRPSGAEVRFVTVALAVVVGVLVALRYLVLPLGPMNWTYQVGMLCLVVAAAVGRALLSDREEVAGREEMTRRSDLALGALVSLAAILPFLPTLVLGFFSDDFSFTAVIDRPKSFLAAFHFTAFDILYRPLHIAMWWLEHHLWGDAPLGYHAVNVAFHGANAVLVYALGRRLMGRRTPAVLAGALFGVHPLHVEAIAWPSCQNDLQATGLSLLSLLCLDVFLRAPRRPVRAAALAGAIGCFALAVFTKESAIALPGVAVLWVLLRSGWRSWPRALLVAGAHAVVLGLYFVGRLGALRGFGGYYSVGHFWNTWFPTAPLRAMHTFFFPINQGLLALLPSPFGLIGLWLLLLTMAGLLFLCMRQLTVVPWRRLGLYLGFLVLLSVPVWQLSLPTLDLEYTRYGYLPTVGLVWLVAEVLAVERAQTGHRRLLPAAVLVGAVVLTGWNLTAWFGARTLVRQAVRSGVAVVREAPPLPGQRAPFFLVQGLPDTAWGAQVFRNGYATAVSKALGRPALIQTVARGGDMPPETLRLVALQPGEYLYRWDPTRRALELVRSRESQGGGR